MHMKLKRKVNLDCNLLPNLYTRYLYYNVSFLMQISISMTMIILGHNNENIKYIQAEFDPRHLIHSF